MAVTPRPLARFVRVVSVIMTVDENDLFPGASGAQCNAISFNKGIPAGLRLASCGGASRRSSRLCWEIGLLQQINKRAKDLGYIFTGGLSRGYLDGVCDSSIDEYKTVI